MEGTPAVSQPKGGRDAVTRRQSVESWFQTEESQEGRETERVERGREGNVSKRKDAPNQTQRSERVSVRRGIEQSGSVCEARPC